MTERGEDKSDEGDKGDEKLNLGEGVTPDDAAAIGFTSEVAARVATAAAVFDRVASELDEQAKRN